jgi:lactose/L-arabinose transport system permease protein
MKLTLTKKSAPYVFLFPVLLFFVSFMLYPIIQSFIYSLQRFQRGQFTFIFFQNYTNLILDPLFRKSLGNTFILLIVQVPVQLFLALVFAILMNAKGLKMKGIFRVGFFLPALTALVAYAIVFQILLNENYGIVNFLLVTLGLDPVPWLSHPVWAKVSLMMAITWRWMGYNMVIMLAGLQTIPNALYDAASIDGATVLQRFRIITVPMLKPIILFCTILSTIGTLQLFDESYILTSGGPNNATRTVAHYLYQQGFQFARFGYASAIAYILVLLIAVLSYIQFKVTGDNE